MRKHSHAELVKDPNSVTKGPYRRCPECGRTITLNKEHQNGAFGAPSFTRSRRRVEMTRSRILTRDREFLKRMKKGDIQERV
jgi:hypothetical protein